MSKQQQQGARRSVEYEQVGADYMEKRQLKQGAAGWVLLAGLGVAYVISGDFAGWNFGLAEGGWGGLLIATSSWRSCTRAWSSRSPSCRR